MEVASSLHCKFVPRCLFVGMWNWLSESLSNKHAVLVNMSWLLFVCSCSACHYRSPLKCPLFLQHPITVRGVVCVSVRVCVYVCTPQRAPGVCYFQSSRCQIETMSTINPASLQGESKSVFFHAPARLYLFIFHLKTQTLPEQHAKPYKTLSKQPPPSCFN